MILSTIAEAAVQASTLAPAAAPIRFEDLGLSPIALDLGFFKLRWYSLAYLAGILGGWWYLLKLLGQPGAPMARRHADDMIFYATLGIILGGRIAYILFYQPSILNNPIDIFKLWEGGMSFHGGVVGVTLGILGGRIAYILFYQPSILNNPIDIFKLWEGGMSFHGGVVGVTLGILYLARKNGLDWLRVHDYVACVVPLGLLLGRLANFVNGELWGRPTDVSWAMIFPTGGEVARHPSQLYEAGLEGLALGALLLWLFWRTDARYKPGFLVGVFILGYGLARFFVEFFRQPDAGLENLPWGLSMGQTLCVPMILGGVYLVSTAKARRVRVEGFAGTASVA